MAGQSKSNEEQTGLFSRWAVQKAVFELEDIEVYMCIFKAKLMVHIEVAAAEPHQTAQTSLTVLSHVCDISPWGMFPIHDAGGP